MILLLTGCAEKDYSKNLFYMDTVINIKLYDISESKANEAFNEIEELYKKYELIVSKYNEDSELYKVNNNQVVEISNELKDVINYSLNWYDKSNGLLNINMGKITEIWNDFRNQNINLPTKEQLNINTDIENITLNNNTITYNENLNIDLGSTAKGYITEQAKEILQNLNIDYYLINAGGNVIVGESTKNYYNIGIKSPIENDTFMIIKDENISVVTSGSYERFYEVDGILYHHIIDPYTNYPANHMKSVTVIGKNSSDCDALSTILFLMPIEEGIQFIKDYDVQVVWFSNDNEIIKSENFTYE